MMYLVIILDQNTVIEFKKKESTHRAIPPQGTTLQKNVHFLKTLKFFAHLLCKSCFVV